MVGNDEPQYVHMMSKEVNIQVAVEALCSIIVLLHFHYLAVEAILCAI